MNLLESIAVSEYRGGARRSGIHLAPRQRGGAAVRWSDTAAPRLTRDSDTPLRIRRTDANSALFDQIVRLRAQTAGVCEVPRRSYLDCVDLVDAFADHYALVQGEPVQGEQVLAAVRIASALRGQLSEAALLPTTFVQKYRAALVSSGRLVRQRGVRLRVEDQFLELVWRSVARQGGRVDVTVASQAELEVYLSRGYESLGRVEANPTRRRAAGWLCILGTSEPPGLLSSVMADVSGALCREALRRDLR